MNCVYKLCTTAQYSVVQSRCSILSHDTLHHRFSSINTCLKRSHNKEKQYSWLNLVYSWPSLAYSWCVFNIHRNHNRQVSGVVYKGSTHYLIMTASIVLWSLFAEKQFLEGLLLEPDWLKVMWQHLKRHVTGVSQCILSNVMLSETTALVDVDKLVADLQQTSDVFWYSLVLWWTYKPSISLHIQTQ